MALADIVNRLSEQHIDYAPTHDRVTRVTTEKQIIRGPLFDELEDACYASSGKREGGGSFGSKFPLDGDALDLRDSIRGVLVHDIVENGARFRACGLAGLARYWWVLRQRTGMGAGEEAVWLGVFAAWEKRILAIVEPRKVMNMRDGTPCPLCGNARVVRGGDSVSALTISFHEDAAAETWQLWCVECGPVAEGVHEVFAALKMEKVKG